MLEVNEMKGLRKIVGKTKIDKIRNQQTIEPCGIQPIDEWVKSGRREWNEHVTRMDARERLVKISRGNILVLAGRASPGCPERRYDLITG